MRFLSTLSIFLLSFACSEPVEKGDIKHPDEIVNPNGDSELAIVMRNLHFESGKAMEALEGHQVPDLTSLRRLIEKMENASPTDPSFTEGNYPAFSAKLKAAFAEFEKSKSPESFNAFITSCIDCHKSSCPGPVKKISKLKVEV